MNDAIPTDAAVGPTDHHTYLGASDIGMVAGESHWGTALDVWSEKRGIKVNEPDDDDIEIHPCEVGNAFERPALELYSMKRGIEVTYPGTLRHPEFPWAGATPDAVGDDVMVVQCKNIGPHMFKFWGEPIDGPDGIPAETLCQVHWETWLARKVVGITGKIAHVLAVKGTKIQVFEVPIDDDMIEGLVQIGREFWENFVVPGVMPEVFGDHAQDILNAIHPRHLRDKLDPITPEVEALARKYVDARDAVTEAEAVKNGVASKLKAAIGDGIGFIGNGTKVTWKAPKGSPSWKKIATEAKVSKEIIKRCTPEFGKRKIDVRIKD